MKKMCKEQRLKIDVAEKIYKEMKRTCHFEDEMCIIDSSKNDLSIENEKMNSLVKAKISLEKYWRKLRHMQKK
jgi:hypothetical protein